MTLLLGPFASYRIRLRSLQITPLIVIDVFSVQVIHMQQKDDEVSTHPSCNVSPSCYAGGTGLSRHIKGIDGEESQG